jgi:hypothetical protein
MSAVAAPIQLCPALYMDHYREINREEVKGVLYRIVGIISYVAFFILFGSMCAVYLGLLALPTWVAIALPFAALLTLRGRTLFNRGIAASAKATFLEKIKHEMNLISGWTRTEIVRYFGNRALSIEQVENNAPVMEALRQIEREEPLRALIPLVAESLVKEQEEASLLAQIQALGPEPTDHATTIETFRLAQNIAWNAVSSAITLQMLQQPMRNLGIYRINSTQVQILEEIDGQNILIGHCSFDPARYQDENEGVDYPRNFYFPRDRHERPVLDEETLTQLDVSEVRERIFGDE